MPDTPYKVLLVEDDDDDRLLIQEALAEATGARYHLDWRDDCAAGRAAVREAAHDAYLIDWRLGAGNGLNLLREAAKANPYAPVIVITGQGDPSIDRAAMNAGAADFLDKSDLRPAVLDRTLRYAIAQKQLQRAHLEQERDLGALTEHLADGILVLGQDGVVRFANPQAARILCEPREALVGRPSPLAVDGAENKELVLKQGTWVEVRVSEANWRSEPARIVTVQDVTRRKRDEAHLRLASEQQATLNRLLRIGQEDLDLPDKLGQCLEEVCEISWVRLEHKAGVFLADGGGHLRLTAHKHLPPELQRLCARVPLGQCLCGRAVQEGRIQYAGHVDRRHTISYPAMPDHGHYAVPLLSGATVLGVLVLYLHAGHRDSEQSRAFLQAVGTTLAAIVEHARAHEALRRSEERYALAARGANDGLWDWDLASGRIYCSPRWREMLGLAPGQGDETLETWLERLHPADMEVFRHAVEAHLAGDTPCLEHEHRMLHQKGYYQWHLCRGLAVRDDTGKATRMAGSTTDITGRKEAEERLLHDALHDALTGLPNRALLLERLNHSLALTSRRAHCLGAALFLDLDHFKVINDSQGHAVGDELLKEVARRLQNGLREGDTVARLGGDEFVMLLDDVRDLEEVVQVIRRVHESLTAPIALCGQELFTAASIGVTMIDSRYRQAEDVLRDADTAMYAAKGQRGNIYAVFHPEMRSGAVRRFSLERELRGALDRGEIGVAFQPIVDLKDGRDVGYEALARWRHPEKGFIPPDEFIRVAEETSLIISLGQQILEMACLALNDWRAAFPDAAPGYVSVNLSPRQLDHDTLYDDILGTLAATGLAPHHLCLEITEGLIMENAAKAGDLLKRLRRAGLRLYMDDFGTGYSSLSYLHQFPLDVLKIDRSFIQRLDQAQRDAELVEIILSLAGKFNLQVVAEGVETSVHAEFLQDKGCAFGQGYFFARPLTGADVLRRLEEARDEAIQSA